MLVEVTVPGREKLGWKVTVISALCPPCVTRTTTEYVADPLMLPE